MRLEKMERKALNEYLRKEFRKLGGGDIEYHDLRVPEFWREEDGKIIITSSFMAQMKRTETAREQREMLHKVLNECQRLSLRSAQDPISRKKDSQ